VELLIGVSSHPRSPRHPLSPRIALGVIGGTTLSHDVPTSSNGFVVYFQGATGGNTNQPESGTTYVSGSDPSLIGPALEVALLKHVFVETDAVYHPIECSRRDVLSNGEVLDSFSGAEGRTWEFPALGKYKFGAGRATPFLEAGPSFRLETENSSVFGISAGAGLELRLRTLKIAPALRFTHWGPQGYHSPSTDIILNQVEFLTGLLL
jgi:hypothetical protein